MCVRTWSSTFALVQGYGSTFPTAPRGEDGGRKRGGNDKYTTIVDGSCSRNVRYADADNASVRTYSSKSRYSMWPCNRRDSTVPASCPFTATKPSRLYTLQPRRCCDGCDLLSVSTAYRCGHLADTSWGSCSVGVSAAAVQQSEGAASDRSPYSWRVAWPTCCLERALPEVPIGCRRGVAGVGRRDMCTEL
jgi:hypothetical protein